MSKKQKIIFIITFILVGLIILSVFFWFNRKDSTTPAEELPWYQQFNPFGTSDNKDSETGEGGVDIESPETESVFSKSRFFQITDFAISGVTTTEEKILVEGSTDTKEIKVKIDSNTKEGRVKIQSILNKSLALTTPIIENGIFTQTTTEALKLFQKQNNLPVTGKIDTATAPLFTETKTEQGQAEYEYLPGIRYVERKNGHLYKMLFKDFSPIKISNSTIPGIHEAFFDKEGGTVLYRYLSNEDIINTFLATLGKPSGEYLNANITDLSVSKDKTRFFYLVENNNSGIGFVQSFATGIKQAVFSHPFTEWVSEWDNNGNLYLTTKASYFSTGNIYILNQSNKTLSKILGGINGLTTKVSPDGKKVLYSVSDNKGPHLMVFVEDGRKFIDLKTYGLADKCVWSSDNVNVYCAIPEVIEGYEYPDIWYQGIVSFVDSFVKIDTSDPDRITIAKSSDEAPVDAINLTLSKNEEIMFFINKKDYTLWSLNIK